MEQQQESVTPEQTNANVDMTAKEEADSEGGADLKAEDFVPRSEFKSVVSESIQRKKRIKELEDQIRAQEEKQMQASQNWETYGKTKAEEAEQWKSKYSALSESLVTKEKLLTVRDEAQKAGILPEAISDLELLNLDDVLVETTSTGRYQVLGAKEKIQKLKTEKPHWFKGQMRNFNSATPEVEKTTAKRISLDDINKEKIKATKSGDWSDYKNLIIAFQSQS